MGRAAGRAHSRRPPKAPRADSPQGREIGLDDRVIPSGIPHLVQQETIPDRPAVPERPPVFRGEMQHGVPAIPGADDNFTSPGDKLTPGHDARKHGSQPVHYDMPPPEPDPLPVYIVEQREKTRTHRVTITQVVTVAAAGGEPTRVCSQDNRRVSIHLMNEATSGGNNIRIGALQANLAGVTATAPADGVLLPPAAGYLKLTTQGELWAVSEAAATTPLSVIIETETDD